MGEWTYLLEKMLKINNRNLPVTWSHENRNMHHSFVIDSIKSEDNAEMMQIEVDGKIMGSSKTEKFEIEIPEKDAFRLLNVSVEYEPEFRVVATFSNAIATDPFFCSGIGVLFRFFVKDKLPTPPNIMDPAV